MTSRQIPEEEDRARNGDLRMLLGWAVLKCVLAAQRSKSKERTATERGGSYHGK